MNNLKNSTMNLIFDLGNTTQKMAVMSSGEVVDRVKKTQIEAEDIASFVERYRPQHAILSSVAGETAEIVGFLEGRMPLLTLSCRTAIPIRNEYKTPHTLGSDRLACAVAAEALFPRQSVLVLQMGTCITSDFITEGTYLGGTISPGLEMRLNALHHFSARLPLVASSSVDFFRGTTTEESILAGIICGMEDECNGMIARYRDAYPSLKIILTGGDAKLFENRIKNEIFAIDNLVLIGLNVILNYNVENKKNM